MSKGNQNNQQKNNGAAGSQGSLIPPNEGSKNNQQVQQTTPTPPEADKKPDEIKPDDKPDEKPEEGKPDEKQDEKEKDLSTPDAEQKGNTPDPEKDTKDNNPTLPEKPQEQNQNPQQNNFKMSTEESIKKTADDLLFEAALGNIIEGSKIGNTEQEYVIYRLVNEKRSAAVYLPAVDDAINPKTGAIERVRLIAGVDTIWMKEQKDLDKDYVRQNLRTLAIHKILRLPVQDKTAIEFMNVSRFNVGKKKGGTGIDPREFYLYDSAAQAKREREREQRELEAAIKASNLSDRRVAELASYLNFNFVDEVGAKKSPDTLKKEVMVWAKRNASEFEKLLESDRVRIAFLVTAAIKSNKIDIGRAPGSAYFGTGKFISAIPSGRTPVDYLTDLATLNNDEGNAFKEELTKLFLA